MTSVPLKSKLETIAKVGAITFAGAFFAGLSFTTIPTTLDGWKALVLPALGAAVAGELVYLRTQLASLLAASTLPMDASTTVNENAALSSLAEKATK